MKLTPRLALNFIFYAAALLAGMGLLAYSSGRAALRSAAIAELSTTAIEKQAALQEWVQEKQSDIAALSSDPTTINETSVLIGAPPGSPEASAARDRLIAEIQPRLDSGEFRVVMLIDPQTGEVIAATDASEEGKFKEDRPFFINGRLGPYVQNLYYAIALQGPGMTASAPVRTSDGKLLAVVAGRLDLEEINAIINRRSGLRQTDDAFLVNTSSLFVTQPYLVTDPAVLQVGVRTEAVNRCLAQSSGAIEADDYRGVPALVVYRWLPERQLCLIVKMDQAEAYAPVRKFGWTVAAISSLALLTAILLAIVLSRSLSQPILALQAGAARFGRGELETRLSATSHDELGDLASEFNKMAAALLGKDAELRAYAQTLELRVEERTAAIKEREKRYRSYIEVTGQLGWTAGAEGEIEDMPEWGKYTGQREEEVKGWGWSKALHPDDLERVTQAWRNAVAARHNYEVEYRLRRYDGEYRHFLARGVPIYNDNGEIREWVGTCIDISERRQAEEALRRFELLADNSKDIILFMRRQDGRIMEANAAALRGYGYSRAELLALTIQDLRAPDIHSLTPDQMAQADAGGILFETIHRRRDGSVFPVEVSSQGATIGGVRTLVSIVRDITERRRAEEEITTLSKFPTENPYPILRVQNDGRLIYANAASQELLEMWGCEINGYLPADLKGFISVAVESHSARTVDVPCNGRVYSITLVPILDSGYVNLYGSDITERRQAEERLARQAEDLQRSNAELEQFAYVASHDLQEPLRMVSSYMQLLSRRYQGRLDGDADEFIAFAVDGAKRMQNLINDLLTYSRVGTRTSPLASVSCTGVLEEALTNLQFAIEESGAIITHERLPVVKADPIQLAMVFQNLLGNAIKFHGSEPPHIKIEAQRRRDEWLFCVRDNGIGFDPKFAERIFVIFQRLHDRSSYPGTGIGLAICKRIIQRHGGRIWVESQPGQGSTFYFSLPARGTDLA